MASRDAFRSRQSFWGSVSAATLLKNSSSAPASNYDYSLRAGDTQYVSATGTLYICTDPTAGAAVWAPFGGTPWVPRCVEVQNAAAYNMNQAGSVPFAGTWGAPLQTTGGGFAVVGSAVSIPVDGLYKVEVSAYVTGTGARTNFGLEVSLNGVFQTSRGASAYIRAASGHNEASNDVATLVQASAGDLVSFRTIRLSTSGVAMNAGPGRLRMFIRLEGV